MRDGGGDAGRRTEAAEVRRDTRRTDFLEKEGWSVHRTWNTDIYNNLKGVLDSILYQLQSAARD